MNIPIGHGKYNHEVEVEKICDEIQRALDEFYSPEEVNIGCDVQMHKQPIEIKMPKK